MFGLLRIWGSKNKLYLTKDSYYWDPSSAEKMNRRHLLAGFAGTALVLLPGCLENRLANTEGNSNYMSYELEAEEVPDDRPIQHHIELLHPKLQSPESPLAIKISIENITDKTIVYGERREALGIQLGDNGFRLLASDDDRYEYDNSRNIWVANEPLDMTADHQTDELSPGEQHSQELVLILREEEELPDSLPAKFDFDMSFSADTPSDIDWSEPDYEWGFSLVKED